MSSSKFLENHLWCIFSFLLVSFGTIFFKGCSSSDSPNQESTGPSVVSGTVFESPLEFDAGENPLGITFADFNDDNKTDYVVASSRKQNGISTTEDGTLTLFQKNSSSSSRFPFTSIIITPATAEWRQDVISADFTGDMFFRFLVFTRVKAVSFVDLRKASLLFSFSFSKLSSSSESESSSIKLPRSLDLILESFFSIRVSDSLLGITFFVGDFPIIGLQ